METQEILLIDDSEEDALLVKRAIDKHLPGRFHISHKENMADAEAYIAEHKDSISLILLDLSLPDTKDGHDTFERMKMHAPDIPIVVLTGLEDHDVALSLMKEGAEDFVNKGLIQEKPESLGNIIEFAACRHRLVKDNSKQYEEKIKDKDDVISWMGGGYSVNKKQE
jgi:two-component system sensor histidine kinase UhpB